MQKRARPRRSFAQAIPQIVWTATALGELDYLNCRWKEFTGLRVSRSLGFHWTIAVHRDDVAALLAAWKSACATGAEFEAEYRLRRADGTHRWMLSRAVPMRDRDERIVKWFGSTIDIEAQRRRELQLQCFDELNSVIDRPNSVSATLQQVAHVIARRIVDWCAIYVSAPGGTFRAEVVEHRDRTKSADALEYARRYGFRMNDDLVSALHAGRALLVPPILLDTIREHGIDDPLEFSRLFVKLDICTTMCVPIVIDERLWGVIGLVSTSDGPTVGEADISLAQTLAQRIATAIRSAMIAESGQREAESLRFIAEACQTLSSSLDVQTTLGVLLRLVVPHIAHYGVISLVDRESRLLLVRALEAADRPMIAGFEQVMRQQYFRDEGCGPRIAGSTAMQTQIVAKITADDIERLVEPPFRALTATLKLRSLIRVALVNAGECIGSLHLMRSDGDESFGPWDAPLIEELARHAAGAIANAGAYEREYRVANSFQDASLPAALPLVPGFRFEAHYVPGRSQARVGGDWYDALRAADGRVIMSIGDVAGSGLAAAVTMSMIRHVLRGVAYVNPDPFTMLAAADKALRAEQPDTFVTAFVAVLDPVTMIVTCASAGHPSGLMVTSDDLITEFAVSGLPLGLRGRNEPAARSVHVRGGALLCFYTDGLTESTRDLFEGERRLHEALRAQRSSESGTPQAIYDAVLFDGAHDDVAILTIAIAPDTCPQRIESTARWTFDVRDAQAARTVRSAFTALLEFKALSPAEVFAARVVFGELVGNVLRYAPGIVEIAVDTSGPAPVLHVLDTGAGFRHATALPKDMLSESGRGLYMAATLTEELHVSRRPAGGSHARAVLTAGASSHALSLPSLDLLLGV